MFYINKKGNRVNLTVTRHAILQFCDRYQRLFNEKITCLQAQKYIEYCFPLNGIVKNFTKKELKRIKKYGRTFYFRDNNFTYVVHDVFIMTVEISKKGFRHLN
jgi:hypothetical protein